MKRYTGADRFSQKQTANICTGRQIAAARALLGWSQRDLARASGLHVNAVAYWEAHPTIPHAGSSTPVACQRMGQALRDAGVVTFIKPTAGVRLVSNPQFPRATHPRAR
jgi:hypothetical protein